MASENHRPFFEKLFSYLTKREVDKFFDCLEPNLHWTIHGENLFAGNHKSAKEVRNLYERYLGYMKSAPKQNVKYLLVEGNKAAAFLQDEIEGKDGKTYIVDYWMMLELSKDGRKVVKIDNYIDSLPLQQLVNPSGHKRMSA